MTNHFDPASYAGIPLDQTRRQVADEIERMIAFLDFIDGDTDLEPSIHGDDREPDLADDITGTGLEQDCCDDEESLGWTVGGILPSCYPATTKANADLEGDEHDGREPDVDSECSLGWTTRVNQDCADWHGSGTDWKHPSNTDLELGDDNGIGDMDGVCEQFGGMSIHPPTGIVMWLPEGVL